MTVAKAAGPDSESLRWYRGGNVPMHVIRRFARHVADRFEPEKIILFGSHAYGKPHADSDVDILVVMPARSELQQAARISISIDPPFPLDIIVRTPKKLHWRVQEGDSFLGEILTKGKVLYEKADARVGTKSRSRLPASTQDRKGKRTVS
jgi:predicted nucleotidyltransferase